MSLSFGPEGQDSEDMKVFFLLHDLRFEASCKTRKKTSTLCGPRGRPVQLAVRPLTISRSGRHQMNWKVLTRRRHSAAERRAELQLELSCGAHGGLKATREGRHLGAPDTKKEKVTRQMSLVLLSCGRALRWANSPTAVTWPDDSDDMSLTLRP